MMSRQSQSGFTLVEMIMVIVITGIIGSMVAVFLRAPITQYLSVASRADMSDVADTALRRIGRDLRLALPNSVRVDASNQYIEFLPTTGGGRYRAAADPTPTATACGSSAANVLDFNPVVDTCFEVLGANPPISVGDKIVVDNLGVPGADAYAGNNWGAVILPLGANFINIALASALPFDSPSHRFQVITTPVSYVCAPATDAAGNGTGTLTRYWGYVIQDVQTKTDSVAKLDALIAVQGAKARLATHVSVCNFNYGPLAVAQRDGLVTMNLGIAENLDTVTLYNEVHVSNVP